MDRRSFLTSTGAALGTMLLPTIQILGPARMPSIDLVDFCEPDCSYSIRRYDMTKPFFQEGLACATDARIAIRTGLILPSETDPEVRLPPLAAVFDALDGESGDWQPWPRKHWVRDSGRYWPQDCPECFGDGRLGPGVVDCPNCFGQGYVLTDCGEVETPCQICKRTGHVGGVECDYCRGEGECDDSKPTLQLVGDMTIAPRYDAKIRRLAAVEWRLARIHHGHQSPRRAVHFRCDGGEGLLMPVEQPHAR